MRLAAQDLTARCERQDCEHSCLPHSEEPPPSRANAGLVQLRIDGIREIVVAAAVGLDRPEHRADLDGVASRLAQLLTHAGGRFAGDQVVHRLADDRRLRIALKAAGDLVGGAGRRGVWGRRRVNGAPALGQLVARGAFGVAAGAGMQRGPPSRLACGRFQTAHSRHERPTVQVSIYGQACQ